MVLVCEPRTGIASRERGPGRFLTTPSRALAPTRAHLYAPSLNGRGRNEDEHENREARGFGMRVIYFNRNRVAAEVESELHAEYLPFDQVLAQADFLSLHVPLTAETRGLIGPDVLTEAQKQEVPPVRQSLERACRSEE